MSFMENKFTYFRVNSTCDFSTASWRIKLKMHRAQESVYPVYRLMDLTFSFNSTGALPWVPEVFLARFLVSVMPLLCLRPPKYYPGCQRFFLRGFWCLLCLYCDPREVFTKYSPRARKNPLVPRLPKYSPRTRKNPLVHRTLGREKTCWTQSGSLRSRRLSIRRLLRRLAKWPRTRTGRELGPILYGR